jgi:hypothetical protein
MEHEFAKVPPGRADLIKHIKRLSPDANAIVLSQHDGPQSVFSCVSCPQPSDNTRLSDDSADAGKLHPIMGGTRDTGMMKPAFIPEVTKNVVTLPVD